MNVLAIVLLASSVNLSAAGYYRCETPDGQTFSDIPCQPGAEKQFTTQVNTISGDIPRPYSKPQKRLIGSSSYGGAVVNTYRTPSGRIETVSKYHGLTVGRSWYKP